MENEGGNDLGFDLDAGVAEVADGLGFGRETEKPDTDIDDSDQDVAPPPPADVKPNGVDPAPPTVREPPKSWAKEKHELWKTLPPEAQDYYGEREKNFLDGIEQYKGDAGYGKQMRDTLAPYEPVIRAAGLDAPRAVEYLMNAHYRLTQGTPEQRKAAYEKLGADLGFKPTEPGRELPPELKDLTDRQNRLESALTERQRVEYTETLNRVSKEVEQFASDEKHPYFDECADDIALYIKAGHELQDAYDRAVMANPVTRAKELARIHTETEAKLRAKGEQETAAARKATGGNVRGVETPKAPTEPKGSMDDTMRDTLKKIRARASN